MFETARAKQRRCAAPVLLLGALWLACGSEGDSAPEREVAEYVPPQPSDSGEMPAPAPGDDAPGSDAPGDGVPGDMGPGGEGNDPNTPLDPSQAGPNMPSGTETEPPVTDPPVDPPAEPSAPTLLRDAADRTGRVIGVAVQARLLNDATYTNMVSEFSSLTAENEMKWQSTEPQPNQFNFAQADRIVDFAEQNAMRVRGHTLVWHSQLPGWVSELTTPEAVRSAMLNHINTLVTRYRGRVFAWDVVNEAMADNASGLRTSVFQQQLGSGFIDEAFRAARAADPDAKLFYNDYGTEGTNNKANAVFAMVQGMVERGVPIDGVGMQMHVNNGGNPTAQQIASNMQRLVDLGLEVNISELDISTCGNGTLDERLAAQAARAHGIVQACVNQPGCTFITVWGTSDQYSWRQNGCDGGALPLLFSVEHEKKPAYGGVFDALMGL